MRRVLGLVLCCAFVSLFGCFGSDDDNGSKGDYKKFRRDRVVAYEADGVTVGWGQYEYDSYGNQLKLTMYEAAGADGKWQTDDDGISFQIRVTTDANGDPLTGVTYNDPGTDKIWGTADDIEDVDNKPHYYRCTNHIITVEYFEYSSTYTKVYMFDTDGNQIKDYYATGSGADGVWGTSDDLCYMNYTVYEPQNSNWNKTQKSYNVGSDQLIGTADDTMMLCTVVTFDGNIPRKSVTYKNINATSATWDLDDTLISGYVVYNQVSGAYRTALYQGAGTDAKWFTEDDVAASQFWFEDYTFDANGTYSKDIEYNGETGEVDYIRTFTWKGFN